MNTSKLRVFFLVGGNSTNSGDAATCTREELLILLKEARSKLAVAEQKVDDLQRSLAKQHQQLEEQRDLLEEKERRIRSYAKKTVDIQRQLQTQASENVAESENDIAVPVIAKQGAPMKDWDKLGHSRKRRESQSIMSELQKTAESRNVEMVQLAGTILHRLGLFLW